ncbi:MAG: hypothetical protein ACI9SC_003011, partial [Gammaproteobacteria bacterium]
PGTEPHTHNDGVPCSNQGVATIFDLLRTTIAAAKNFRKSSNYRKTLSATNINIWRVLTISSQSVCPCHFPATS